MESNPPSKPESTGPKSLGLVKLEPGTFDHDVTIGAGYQAFSAELLRLSLAGLGVVGFLATKFHTIPTGQTSYEPLPTCVKIHLGLAIGSLTLCAGLALLHRYFATDSLANHLAMVRAQRGGRDVTELRQLRRSGFNTARVLLLGSSLTLWLGALFLGIGFLLSLA